jgi:hypothetical protein
MTSLHKVMRDPPPQLTFTTSSILRHPAAQPIPWLTGPGEGLPLSTLGGKNAHSLRFSERSVITQGGLAELKIANLPLKGIRPKSVNRLWREKNQSFTPAPRGGVV